MAPMTCKSSIPRQKFLGYELYDGQYWFNKPINDAASSGVFTL